MLDRSAPESAMLIDARPTKDFFISMLGWDIGLIRVIIDLVDNCLDGARRVRPDGDYRGLCIRINLSSESFKISDNCGGIPPDLARDYAFRFGRPRDMQPTKHSVGQFGVGMKRALFKLGTKFTVESTTEACQFVVEVDVDEWRKDDERWQFEFKVLRDLSPKPATEEQRGTTITGSSLHPSVAEEFDLETFHNRLRLELETAHQESLTRNMTITLNAEPLQFQVSRLLKSEDLHPAFQELVFDESGHPPLQVRVYAGVSHSDPSKAGWYIYCNGRCVVEAEQTGTTGWGEGGETTIPKYHNQFARFRGYVFFDCDDADRLPWKTTKTGVDSDSPIFRRVRQKMVSMMRPVIDFLNRLDAEKSLPEEPTPLTDAVEGAAAAPLDEVEARPVFCAPEAGRPAAASPERRIQYTRPWDKVERARSALKVPTLKEVGERTFDYYYTMECED